MFLINPSKILFMGALVLGTMTSISSSSWLGTWMGLEINLLAFVPLMYSKKNVLSSEASMKYFIVQAMASSLLLTSIILFSSMSLPSSYFNQAINLLTSTTLLIKMGAAPFHMWFPPVMEGLTWFNCLILMTWQKLAPFMIISYLNQKSQFIFYISILSIIVGSLGGLSQTSTRKIMAYSSINHIGWMLMAMSTSEMLWQIYFVIYCVISFTLILTFMSTSIYYINQLSFNHKSPTIKMMIMLNMMSLGGLPPFLGFLPKWMVIHSASHQNLMFIVLIMVCVTLITLFYYIQLAMSSYILSNNQLKWHYWNNKIYSFNLILLTSSASLISLPLILLTYYNL